MPRSATAERARPPPTSRENAPVRPRTTRARQSTGRGLAARLHSGKPPAMPTRYATTPQSPTTPSATVARMPSAEAGPLEVVVGRIPDHLAVRGNAARAMVLDPEGRRHGLGLEHAAAAGDLGHPTRALVPADRELGAGEGPGPARLRVVGDGLVVVEVLAAQEQDAAVLELEVVVGALVLELRHAEGAGGPERRGREQPEPLQLTQLLPGALAPERIGSLGVE